MTSRQTKVGLTLAAVIVLAVAGTFGTREVVRWRDDEAERMKCANNLKTLALAIHDYSGKNGDRLPPAYVLGNDGKPWHSWRVLILPYLNRGDLYEKYHFDEPWNGPHNIQLIDQMPDVFGCPADQERDLGKTSYFAIVGSQTMWPGPRTPTYEEITTEGDGTSNTFMILESTPTDVAWTEPRDITMQELFPNDDDIGPRFASRHDRVIQVVMGDGAVRQVRFPFQEGARRYLHAYVTAWTGKPYKGEWLPGEEQVVDVGEFPPEVGAEILAATDIVAHMHGRISTQHNTSWCATAQIAWDELRQKLGVAPKIADCEIAAGLGKTPFPLSALDPAAYVAKMGAIEDGIQDKIRAEMKSRFPEIEPNLKLTVVPDDDRPGVIMYCFLKKNLPFKTRFDRLREPLVFHAPSGDVRVKSFGFKKLKDAGSDASALNDEASVLNYVSEDDFVIQLQTKSDEIILAKVPPAATLRETLSVVQKRIGSAGHVRPRFENEESLMVPNLAFNVLRNYQELRGKIIDNFIYDGPIAKWKGWPYQMAESRQSVRFLLNERGARLESEALDSSFVGDSHEKIEPPKPRHFVLDKPFLLYVKEKKADVPYLVLWVANGEIMQKFEQSTRHP